MVARQAPRGACTSTVSPDLRPRSAEPSGEVGDTVPEPPTALISTVISSRPSSTINTTEPMPTSSPLASSTISGVVEPVSQCADACFEKALLVLGRVVLEVLREVAELAGRLDRGHDGRAPRALELGELLAERFCLFRG